ncbi:LuxR C-terminal-related transcriptional regulator [Polluticoccus soli]|uniref:LuxR C-terminal-related transcriptional regulator n=1 Tax=Polluticoccus soli TaxID=3034150 RepID=UPI0023E27B8B|nr:response regulator transcription factor [Flavipsychrobacter sp. JY13-12]
MALKDIKIIVGLAMKDMLLLDSLVTALEVSDTVQVAAKATTNDKFINQLSKSKLRPSVCIIDFSIPNSYKLIRDLKSRWPRMRLLVVVSAYSQYTIDVLIFQKVNGFIGRNASVKQLIDAIGTVKKNKFYYSPIAKEKRFSAIKNREISVPRLTTRQVEFLNHCVTSANYVEIAEKLEISVRGVDSIRDLLFEKFGVRNRTDLVMEAIRSGIVSVN